MTDRPTRRALPPALAALVRPFEQFLRTETRSGTLLVLATVIALVWANTPESTYDAVWGTKVRFEVGGEGLAKPALLWINDLLMAGFFLLVGLEIKRELLDGELNTLRKAALPAVAALGGMLVPALIYAAVGAGSPAMRAWAVPMATDIAFALGLTRLLGARVPAGLLIFLSALAIIDDLGAVLVIALFYGHGLDLTPLAAAGALLVVLIAMNRFKVRASALYVLVGLPLWYAVYESGLHATIAGVLVGFTVPSKRETGDEGIVEQARELVDLAEDPARDPEDRKAALIELEHRINDVQAPLVNLEHALLPYVAYGIVPLFALANAGVAFAGVGANDLLQPASLGIVLGLFLGKPLGIVLPTLLAARFGGLQLPQGVTARHIVGAGFMGGIGFTMSLFVAGLAYESGSTLHDQAKIGILLGSALSCAVGLAILATGARSEPARD